MDVLVPDIGDFKDVPVIEVLVKPGDKVQKEQPLVTLESDKATLDVPSPAAGTVQEVSVKIGDKVSQGTLIAKLDSAEQKAAPVEQVAPEKPYREEPKKKPEAPVEQADPQTLYQTTPREHGGPTPTVPPAAIDEAGFHKAHAGPAVRGLARDLGVDLARVKGTGP